MPKIPLLQRRKRKIIRLFLNFRELYETLDVTFNLSRFV